MTYNILKCQHGAVIYSMKIITRNKTGEFKQTTGMTPDDMWKCWIFVQNECFREQGN